MKLDNLLVIPSIRTSLDAWLISKDFGGSQPFRNHEAIRMLENLIISLKEHYQIPINDGIRIVTTAAEALAKEIYDY